MLDLWLREVKEKSDPDSLGMILVHDGIVRGTSKTGQCIKGMHLSHDKEKLDLVASRLRMREGIVDIRVWINSGKLKVGDDIMLVLVAGRFRTDILPVFTELLTAIKGEIVREREIS
ncbi:MAG TPA: molybdenum cofactor biosynthesis protein MoaE [Syntrophorhabdales bacterium]|nr:molybdenum cofactor biosynthesis protein MoaE [Syntrophorhabdales bacterium]